MIFDWNNWWALELSSGPSKDMDYLKTCSRYYQPFYERNIPVDILSTEAKLDGYKIIILPMLYMMKEGVAEKLTRFTQNGGILIATVMSGLVDENDRCVFGEYPGKLRDVLGIWVEETDALRPEERNCIVVKEGTGFTKPEYDCGFLCDIIHLRGAESLGSYGIDFYQETPCVTKHEYGQGKAYYIGTEPSHEFLQELTGQVLEEAGVRAFYAAGKQVEITRRDSQKGQTVFAINHGMEASWVDFGKETLKDYITGKVLTGKTTIQPWDVIVAARKES